MANNLQSNIVMPKILETYILHLEMREKFKKRLFFHNANSAIRRSIWKKLNLVTS